MDKILIIEGDMLLAREIKDNIVGYFDNSFEIDICHGKEEAKSQLMYGNYFLAIVSYNINNEKKGESLNYTNYHQIPTLVLLDNLNKKVIKKINDLNIIDYIIKSKMQDKLYLNLIIERIRKNKQYKALVLADSYIHRKKIQNHLQNQLIESIETDKPAFAIDMIKMQNIKILCIDFNLYKMRGTDFIEVIRKLYIKEKLIILATPSIKENLSSQFLKLGANDYISHNFTREEFNSRINNLLEASENIEKMKGLAYKDYLTNLSNRREFYEQIDSYIKNNTEGMYSISLIDIDNFKAINDNYGHDIGDIAIQKLAEIIKNNTKNSDIIARFGGDEFCIVLKNISKEDNLKLLEKIKNEFYNNSIDNNHKDIKCSISIGTVLTEIGAVNDINEIIQISDKNLYISKDKGKNEITHTEVLKESCKLDIEI